MSKRIRRRRPPLIPPRVLIAILAALAAAAPAIAHAAPPATFTLKAGTNVIVHNADPAATYSFQSSTGDSDLLFEYGDTDTQCKAGTAALGKGRKNLNAVFGHLPPKMDLCVVSPVDGLTLTVSQQ